MTPEIEDFHQAWRDACEDAADAYAAWCAVGTDGRRVAHAVYVAAADREGAAARVYRQATLGDGAEPSEPLIGVATGG